ncbi:unnamed protein product [Rhizophagus irregularis]|nr:unnamed protein product [Rhizophagus irregularis]
MIRMIEDEDEADLQSEEVVIQEEDKDEILYNDNEYELGSEEDNDLQSENDDLQNEDDNLRSEDDDLRSDDDDLRSDDDDLRSDDDDLRSEDDDDLRNEDDDLQSENESGEMLTADHDFSENDSFGFDILQGEGLFSDDESSNSTRGNIL